ncbi:MAG: leucine-rich repeat domain-containing protein [Clostridia bacterium]|nr:leucine-rich repeat domain-containing protein [Clostridia bacterium]
MKKRIAAVLAALLVLFAAASAATGEPEDGAQTEKSYSVLNGAGYIEGRPEVGASSGYSIPTFTDGDFKYRMSDDGESAVLVSYTGDKADVAFPDAVNGLTVTAIDPAACLCNPVLETIRIPGSIQTIGIRAFAQCPGLKTVVIEEGVTILDKCCFGGCNALEEILLPESLEIVDDCAFASCDRLREIAFGSGLQSIGNMAFLKCSLLSRVILPGGDDVLIGEEAFGECAEDLKIVY